MRKRTSPNKASNHGYKVQSAVITKSGLSATSQQYFSLRTNQHRPPASAVFFLQKSAPATSWPNRLEILNFNNLNPNFVNVVENKLHMPLNPINAIVK
jgi:hypothetical protein